MKNIAMFIAFQGFRDEEYIEPKKIFEKAGHKIFTVSTARGQAAGKFGLTTQIDKTINEINPSDYQAFALIGGPCALQYLDTPPMHSLLRSANAAGIIIGAICISPVVLAHAGIISGLNITCWPEGKNEIIKSGAKYTGSDLAIDGKIITANGPAAAVKYGQAIVDALKKVSPDKYQLLS